MAILWSRFFRGTLQFWMSLQLLQLGWGRQSWLGTGDHFWGDSRTPFAVANKGANSHTDTLLNIPKKSSRYVKLNCLLDSFLGFFSGETKAEIYDTQDRKIQVCIKYIFLYVHNIILVVLSSQHLGRGKFHSENPSEKKKTKAIQGFGGPRFGTGRWLQGHNEDWFKRGLDNGKGVYWYTTLERIEVPQPPMYYVYCDFPNNSSTFWGLRHPLSWWCNFWGELTQVLS